MKFLIATFLLFSTVSVSCGATVPSDSDKGSEAAQTIFKERISPFAGSREAVQKNLLQPLVAGTPLKTLDGTTSFNSSALTTSDKPLMRISAYPNMPTGDLQKIIVEQDLTATGSYTTAAVFPAPSEASGQMIASVCANGYVMCNPGTYSNCRFRQWKADSTGLITSEAAGGAISPTGAGVISPLSSCYCFNKACSRNNNAVLNVDNITANVGGGILAAFLEAKTGLIVTGAQSTGTGQITYSGVLASSVPDGTKVPMSADQAAAMPVTSSADVKQLQTYYKDPGALTSFADSARQQQTGAPNSIYNSVAKASTNQGGTNVNCTNMVTPTLILQTVNGNEVGGQGYTCADHLVYAVLNQTDVGKFSFGVVGTGPSGLSSIGQNCPNTFSYNDELKYNANFVDRFELVQPPSLYGYEITSVTMNMDLWAAGCNNGTVSARWNPSVGINNPVVVNSSMTCPNNGAQSPNYTWNWVVEYKAQELSNVTNLGCAQLEQDPKCTVQQEMWDTRPVIVNGLATGFKLGQVCKDIMGPLRNVHYCTPPERLWFRQDKTFYCKTTAAAYDFGPAMRRVKEIQDSSTMTNDRSGTYSDGGIVSSLNLPVKGADAPCSQVCQTKIPTDESVMTYNGMPATDSMTTKGVTGQRWSYFYKDCEAKVDGSWGCPTDTAKGEVVVTQCGCSSDMGSVIGALSAAEEAAQDSICSSN